MGWVYFFQSETDRLIGGLKKAGSVGLDQGAVVCSNKAVFAQHRPG